MIFAGAGTVQSVPCGSFLGLAFLVMPSCGVVGLRDMPLRHRLT